MPDEAESYTLKAIVYGDEDDLVVATCDVAANGRFSLQLPATVADAYLENAGSNIPDGIEISDPNAQIGMLWLELYADGEYMEDLTYASFSVALPEISISIATPVYSTSNFKMTGSGVTDMFDFDDVEMSMDMRFVKGWNWMVPSVNGNISSMTFTGSSATKLPGGMLWYLEGDFGDLLGR